MRTITELRTERRKLHITQKAVAAAMGTTQSALSRTENEGNPTQAFLKRYEQALGTLAAQLAKTTTAGHDTDAHNTSMVEIATIRMIVMQLAERYGIAEMYVFGSVARGEAQPDSDVDLLYRLKPQAPQSLLELQQLRAELAEQLGRPVSLTSYDALERSAKLSRASQRFLDHITPDLIKVA